MLFHSPQNPNSHLTVKNRRWPPFPTKQLYLKGHIKGKVLDFGCGTEVDVDFLKSHGLDVQGYGPFYKPEFPTGKFDCILCNYVLNVLLAEEQAHVLMAISELLKPDGKAFYAVRRDISQNGFRYNPKHRCKTYQCNVVLPFKSILLTDHCEIYEYQHINQVKSSSQTSECEYCNPSADMALLTESATAYSLVIDSAPENHCILVIPKKHVKSYFGLSFKEQCACWLMVNRVKALLSDITHPNNYEVYFGERNFQEKISEHICIVLNLL